MYLSSILAFQESGYLDEYSRPENTSITYDQETKNAPVWLNEIMSVLKSFAGLKQNWDSYGAPLISRDSINEAIALLPKLVSCDTPKPSVVPSSSGYIQIEWHIKNIDLEFKVISSTNIEYDFEDLNDEFADEEGNLDIDLSPLVDKISVLTNRQE